MAVVGDLRVLLRFRDFRRLLVVRLLSQLSDGVYQVALATYVVFSPEKQTSAAKIAATMAVLLLPYSVLGPFVGVLLDRWRRRQVLLYCNLLRAVFAAVTAVLILAHVPDWLFYLSALSVTAVNRFVLAGLSAALPRVVDGERLVIANSLSPDGRHDRGDGGRRGDVHRAPGRGARRGVGCRRRGAGGGAVPVRRAVRPHHAPGLLGPDPDVAPARLWAALAEYGARTHRRTAAPGRPAPRRSTP